MSGGTTSVLVEVISCHPIKDHSSRRARVRRIPTPAPCVVITILVGHVSAMWSYCNTSGDVDATCEDSDWPVQQHHFLPCISSCLFAALNNNHRFSIRNNNHDINMRTHKWYWHYRNGREGTHKREGICFFRLVLCQKSDFLCFCGFLCAMSLSKCINTVDCSNRTYTFI